MHIRLNKSLHSSRISLDHHHHHDNNHNDDNYYNDDDGT